MDLRVNLNMCRCMHLVIYIDMDMRMDLSMDLNMDLDIECFDSIHDCTDFWKIVCWIE